MAMDYRMMKLFLTAVEHDEAQALLARIARRKVFTARERAAKQRELLNAMRRKDLLAQEIRVLEGRAA